jgi:hypothetical protein
VADLSGWRFFQRITIQSSEVPSDLTDFPVYVDLSDLGSTFFNEVQSGGEDIRVTLSDKSTLVPREVVTIDTGGQDGNLYFRADTLASGSDTDFYIWFGNASASAPAPTDPNGRNAVWSNGYHRVYHFGDDPTNGVALDSTGGADATIQDDGGGDPSRVLSGPTGAHWDVPENTYLKIPIATGVLDTSADPFTIQSINATDSDPVTQDDVYIASIQDANGDTFPIYYSDANQSVRTWNGNGFDLFSWTVSKIENIALVHRSDESIEAFRDGSSVATSSNYNYPDAVSELWAMWSLNGVMKGRIYSWFLSGVSRTAGWTLTRNNNERGTSSFYSTGAAEFNGFKGSGTGTATGGANLDRRRSLSGFGEGTARGFGELNRIPISGRGEGTASGGGTIANNVPLDSQGIGLARGDGQLSRLSAVNGGGQGVASGGGSLLGRLGLSGSGQGIAVGTATILSARVFGGTGVGRALGTVELGDIKAHWVVVDGSVESEDAGDALSITGLDTSKVHVFQVLALDTAYNFSRPATITVSPVEVSVTGRQTDFIDLEVRTPDPSLSSSIKLYCATSQGGPYTEIKEFTDLSETIRYTDDGLSSGTDYYYKAEAFGQQASPVESAEAATSTAKLLQTSIGRLQVGSTGEVQVRGVGFEPDLIAFEITANTQNFGDDIRQGGEEWGWGYGYSMPKDGTHVAMAVASGSSSTNGQVSSTTTTHGVYVPVLSNDGATIDGWIEARVTSTSEDGFTLQFDSAYSAWHLTWTAYQLGPNGEAEVGFEKSPTSTGTQEVSVGFEPNFLRTAIQPNDGIQSGDDQVVDAQQNGWGHGLAADNGQSVEQVSASVAMWSSNINMHGWGSSDTDALYAIVIDSTEDIVGRIRASLSSFDAGGFTLDFDGVDQGQPYLYCAIKTEASLDIGYGRTPTSTSTESEATENETGLVKVLASNTIEDINIEGEVDNTNDGHHGWMQGLAKAGGAQFGHGFSSHSNSVDGHYESGSAAEGFNLVYSDEGGNNLGKDRAAIEGLGSGGFDLNFKQVTTTSSGAVRIDRTLYIYWTFS